MHTLRHLLTRFRRHAAADTAANRLRFHLHKALASADGALKLDLALDIERGSSVALLGPSGSGKTTLLRMLAGLTPADGGHIHAFGTIWLDSRRGITLPPRKRRAGLVFQDYALFPNMSTRGNVRFALPRGRPASRADELLERVGLAALAERRPAQLSGGQQQRLALARALAAEPALLLLDEPLSALDNSLRRELQDALAALQRLGRTTTLLVTHDPAEAIRLCDRAVQIRHGRIVADGPPATLSCGTGTPGQVIAASTADGLTTYRIEAPTGTAPPFAVGDTVRLHDIRDTPPPSASRSH